MKIDEELIQGCQRYLDELKRRAKILEEQKAEQRKIEEQKIIRREYWRKVLYGHGRGLTSFIVPEKSKFKEEK